MPNTFYGYFKQWFQFAIMLYQCFLLSDTFSLHIHPDKPNLTSILEIKNFQLQQGP